MTPARCRHVSVLAFTAGTTAAQVAAVADALAGLPERIPEIRDYRFGVDLELDDDTHDFGIVADFDSVEDYLVYRDHPAHRAVIAEHIRPVLAARAVVQYTL